MKTGPESEVDSGPGLLKSSDNLDLAAVEAYY